MPRERRKRRKKLPVCCAACDHRRGESCTEVRAWADDLDLDERCVWWIVERFTRNCGSCGAERDGVCVPRGWVKPTAHQQKRGCLIWMNMADWGRGDHSSDDLLALSKDEQAKLRQDAMEIDFHDRVRRVQEMKGTR